MSVANLIENKVDKNGNQTMMQKKFSQAHIQAPWRTRFQRAGLIALVITGVILVGMIYLNISAQAAAAGMEIQRMQLRKQSLVRAIADLRTEFAFQSSIEQMRKRAEIGGYKNLTMDKAIYVVVPGYLGRQQINLAPPPGPDMIPQQVMKPSYTQSLWEVFFQPSISQSSTGGN